MTYGWHDLIGNLGVAIIILSYLALLNGRVDGQSMRYAAANAIGAGLVLASLTVDFNLSAAVIEGFWIVISVYGMVKAWRRREGGIGGRSP